ncbi:MAG TPA: nuclear transport factor 2 family protein [Candidatus Dormibacteraeota bacterium]|nr:nuclear transport factor 2 family protein [Candidatus Dormibacteraeota bacterium]
MDPDAMLACLADDYHAGYPAHPSRDFMGREPVRRIHDQLFAGVPDLAIEPLRSVVDGDVVWTELEWRGTRRDGAPFLMRGPFLSGVRDGVFAWLRFYSEPVERAEIGRQAPPEQHVND